MVQVLQQKLFLLKKLYQKLSKPTLVETQTSIGPTPNNLPHIVICPTLNALQYSRVLL